MPPKKKLIKRKRAVRIQGFRPEMNARTAPQYGGQEGDGAAWDWIKGAANTVYQKAIRPAAKFIKDNRILSTAAGFIPHPAAGAAAGLLRQAGLGRRRPKRVPIRQVLKF